MKKQEGLLKLATALSALALLGLAACSPNTQALNSDIDGQNIIGGDEVLANDPIAPTTVSLGDIFSGQVICTGSIIGKDLVVTAAHCTLGNPKRLVVIFGRVLPKENEKPVYARVVAGLVHPNWEAFNKAAEEADKKGEEIPDTNWGDIALLKLEKEVPAGFKPAKLLSKYYKIKKDSVITLAGYGITDGVKQTDTDRLLKVDVTMDNAAFSETEVLLDQTKGKGACHGDSGGPAFYKVRNTQYLFGVTSRGHDDPQDHCNGKSVYTNINAYRDWLKKTAEDFGKLTNRPSTISE